MAHVEALDQQPQGFSLGSELIDGFKPSNAWVASNITWLDDVQQFYRERSAIEKEYSQRLNALAKKYYEKKLKKTTVLSVGETPTRTPGSLESASVTTWTTHLSSLEVRAAQHDKFGTDLISWVAEPLRIYSARFEELRRRHVEHAERLERERDAKYSELRKVKGKYDSACQEVESKRKKAEASLDKAKAQSNYAQHLIEMNNAKNTYLIAINVTNKQKAKYYHEYVPELLDSLQDLAEFRTAKLNEIWTKASGLEQAVLQEARLTMETLAQEITRNLPQLDTNMFIQHNVSEFREPPDKAFEPSPVWHDDDAMVVDEPAKVYLRNVLARSKDQLGELRREVDKKRRDVEAVKQTKQRIREGTENQDEVEVVRSIFALQEELHQLESKRITAEVETSTITSAVGDVTIGAKNHNFKAQSLKLPTNCDLCGDRIWGLSAKALTCRDCGFTCHTKCEMKVPAACPGELSKEERKKVKFERQEQANALLRPAAVDHIAEHSLGRSNTLTSVTSARARSISGSINSRVSTRSTSEVQTPVLASTPTPTLPPMSPPVHDAPGPPAGPATGTSSVVSSLKSTNTSVVAAAPPKRRIMAPPPSTYITGGAADERVATPKLEQKGRMLYAFEANGEGEITVPQGREVAILQPDEGTGWIKVRAGYKEGFVPASYVEVGAAEIKSQHTGQSSIIPESPASARPSSIRSNSGMSGVVGGTGGGGTMKKKGPAVAPKRGARMLKYVVALYPYTAQLSSEHSMEEGERFVLIKEDQGDGWAEVEKGGITKSVPASYIQSAP